MSNTSTQVTTLLAQLLADTYALALKTQNYHWNVASPDFHTLHKLFEEQYVELYATADMLAERMRALGDYAPGSFSEFAKLASVTEAKKGAVSKEMLVDLAASHEKVATVAKKLILISQESRDDATADIAIGRVEAHEKTTWMLKASIA